MTLAATRLVVVTTHPVQYIAPWFRELALRSDVEFSVIYFRQLDSGAQGTGFGQSFHWDVPLLEGYDSETLWCSATWASLPPLVWRLLRALRAARPDIVLITGWNEAGLMVTYPIAKILGSSVFLRGEANNLRPRGPLKSWLHRLLVKFADAVLTIGKSNRAFYLEAGVDQSRLFPGAYFVESERLVAMAEAHAHQREATRAALGFTPADRVFAFCGKHVPFKRPMMLVDAAALVRARGFPVKLLFAGSGDLTDSLKRRASELTVDAVFTGFLNQTELWKVYLPADAFVLPSTNQETWGLVTNEAMIFGLPVIVSEDVGCAADLVIKNETGFTFSEGAEGLANAIMKLLEQGERMAAMGQAARQRVLQHYSSANATAGLVSALESVRR